MPRILALLLLFLLAGPFRLQSLLPADLPGESIESPHPADGRRGGQPHGRSAGLHVQRPGERQVRGPARLSQGGRGHENQGAAHRGGSSVSFSSNNERHS